jgi:hypothetical protein
MGKLRPYKFGSAYATATVLPLKMPVWDFGTGNVYLPLIDLPGGKRYTFSGSTRARPQAETITYSAYAAYASVSDLENGIGTYTLLEGTYNKLWLYDDTVYRWRYATLREVAVDIDPRVPLLAKYRFTWEPQAPGWFDYALTSVTTTLNTSPKTITVDNTGTLDVFDAILTVTAGSANITALEIKATTPGFELDYAGTITAGQALVIDCGAKSVLNNAVADYANFSLGAAHVIDEWSQFTASPDVDVVVTLTGGDVDSTFKYEFYAGYY